jgi:hypothetical protein
MAVIGCCGDVLLEIITSDVNEAAQEAEEKQRSFLPTAESPRRQARSGQSQSIDASLGLNIADHFAFSSALKQMYSGINVKCSAEVAEGGTPKSPIASLDKPMGKDGMSSLHFGVGSMETVGLLHNQNHAIIGCLAGACEVLSVLAGKVRGSNSDANHHANTEHDKDDDWMSQLPSSCAFGALRYYTALVATQCSAVLFQVADARAVESMAYWEASALDLSLLSKFDELLRNIWSAYERFGLLSAQRDFVESQIDAALTLRELDSKRKLVTDSNRLCLELLSSDRLRKDVVNDLMDEDGDGRESVGNCSFSYVFQECLVNLPAELSCRLDRHDISVCSMNASYLTVKANELDTAVEENVMNMLFECRSNLLEALAMVTACKNAFRSFPVAGAISAAEDSSILLAYATTISAQMLTALTAGVSQQTLQVANC